MSVIDANLATMALIATCSVLVVHVPSAVATVSVMKVSLALVSVVVTTILSMDSGQVLPALLVFVDTGVRSVFSLACVLEALVMMVVTALVNVNVRVVTRAILAVNVILIRMPSVNKHLVVPMVALVMVLVLINLVLVSVIVIPTMVQLIVVIAVLKTP